MSLDLLPDEILLHILSYIDSCLAVHRLLQVSHRFRSLALTFVQTPAFWRKCCLNEIPESVLLDLSGKPSIEDLDKDYSLYDNASTERQETDLEAEAAEEAPEADEDDFTWEDLYKAHKRTWMIGYKQGKEMRHVIETERPVSSLRINGDYLLVGCYGGTLSVWDHLTGDLVLSGHANYRGITNMELIDDHNFGLLEPRLGLRTRVVVTGGIDRYVIIHVINMTVRYCDVYWKYECADRILQIRVFGETLVVSAMDSFLAGVRVLDARRRAVLYHLYGHQSSPGAVTIWKNQVICGCTKGDLKMWRVSPRDVTDDVMHEGIINQAETVLGLTNESRFMDVVARDGLLLALTVDCNLHVSLKGEFSVHFLFTRLKSSPKMLRMKGDVIAVGTNAGTWALYRMTSQDDVRDLVGGRPTRHLRSGTDNVYDMDLSDDGDGPMVAIATSGSRVVVIRWYL